MMQLKAYKNELIIVIAFLLLVGAFVFKQIQVSNQSNIESENALSELQEVIALKKTWGNKRITKKIDGLKNTVSLSKVKWNKNGKKLTASFSNLNNQELNRLVNKIINLAVEIQKLDIKKLKESYQVEFKCKW